MRLYGAFSKVEPQNDGTVRVEGIASSETIDDQGEIILAAAMRAAIPDYMVFPALREMHQLSAAGTTLEAEVGDDGLTRIVGHVVDPVAVTKIKNKVYRGFSIGGRVTKRDSSNSKIITGILLSEISLVDRPANPKAIMECWKSSNIERTDDMEPGLATLGDTPVGEALAAAASTNPGTDAAKTAAVALMDPVQIWACGDNTHSHIAKGEATRCIEKRAASGENGGTQWEPEPVAEVAAVEEPGPAPAIEEPTEKSVQVAESVDQPAEAEKAAADPPEAASEAEADADTAEAVEADPPAAVAEKAAQEPSEAELALAKAVELAVRARAALKLPAAADETSETASEGLTGDKTAKADVGPPVLPLDTEWRIKATWAYLHGETATSKYTGAELTALKASAVAAWKEKIDKAGPPEDAEMAATAGADIAKSLNEAVDLIDVIMFLDNVQDRLQWEAAVEGDGSTAPGAVAGLIAQTCAALRALVDEETAEIVAGTEVDVDDVAAMAAKAGGIIPLIERLTGNGFESLAQVIEKATTKYTAKNQELLDTAYECASRAGSLEGCSKASAIHLASACESMKAAGANGWGAAKKASAEATMVDALAKGGQHKALMDTSHECVGKVMGGSSCSASKAANDAKASLSMAHDHLCAAGATCPAASQKAAAVESPESSDQLAKVQSENAQLLKAVHEFMPLVERLLETNTSLADQIAKIDEKVDRIDQQEAPPRGLARSAGLFALSKAQDNGAAGGASGPPVAPVSPEEILKSINALPDSKDKAFLLMQIAHTNPRPVKMVSQAETNLSAQ